MVNTYVELEVIKKTSVFIDQLVLCVEIMDGQGLNGDETHQCFKRVGLIHEKQFQVEFIFSANEMVIYCGRKSYKFRSGDGR